MQKSLITLDFNIAFLQLYGTGTTAFDFRAEQLDARLKAFQDIVVMKRLPVGRQNWVFRVLPGHGSLLLTAEKVFGTFSKLFLTALIFAGERGVEFIQ